MLALGWYIQGGDDAKEAAEKGYLVDSLIELILNQDTGFAEWATPEKIAELKRRSAPTETTPRAKPIRLEAVAAAKA